MNIGSILMNPFSSGSHTHFWNYPPLGDTSVEDRPAPPAPLPQGPAEQSGYTPKPS